MGKQMNVIEKVWSDKSKPSAEEDVTPVAEDVEPVEEDVDLEEEEDDEEDEEDVTSLASHSVRWATFILPVRISTQSTVVPAVIASATTRLTKETWEDLPVLVVDDAAVGEPVRVPWGAIASFGAD